MDNYAEKRDFQRMAIECVMTYRCLDDERAGKGAVKNLSAKGFLLDIDDEFTEKSELLVKLTPVNAITPPMEAKASVIRSTPIDATSPTKYEVACEIIEILKTEE